MQLINVISILLKKGKILLSFLQIHKKLLSKELLVSKEQKQIFSNS